LFQHSRSVGDVGHQSVESIFIILTELVLQNARYLSPTLLHDTPTFGASCISSSAFITLSLVLHPQH